MSRRFDGLCAVTDGDKGCYWVEGGELHHLLPPKVVAVDTLAAGDVFHGAFTLSVAEGKSITESVRFASAAAAIKCTVMGGRLGAPRRYSVEALLAQG